MYKKRERRAEKRVGGDVGIGESGTDICGISEGGEVREGLRSGLRRTGTKEGGGGTTGGGKEGAGVGEGEAMDWERERSVDWRTRSRKGAQK
jgi:hypothetical protein